MQKCNFETVGIRRVCQRGRSICDETGETHPQYVCFLYLRLHCTAHEDCDTMQHPNATAVATLIVAVAEVQSGAPPVRGAGGGEEAEPYNEAANAGHQGDANVQQQLKGLHARVKATEHDLKMRVCRVDWQDEIKAIQTDLQARHALEMRALERSIDNKVQAALDEYKQKNHLEMKILVDTMFAGLVDKTKELTIELGQYKFLLTAKLEEAQAEATENMDSAVKRMTTSSREADMARTTAQAEFEQQHAVKMTEMLNSISTQQCEYNLHSNQQNHAVAEKMRSHHDTMLSHGKMFVEKMTDTVAERMAASCADILLTTSQNQHLQHETIKVELARQFEVLEHRLASLEEMQEESRKSTDHVPVPRREQQQGRAASDDGMHAAPRIIPAGVGRNAALSAEWCKGDSAPATFERVPARPATSFSKRAHAARQIFVPENEFINADGTLMTKEQINFHSSMSSDLMQSGSSTYHSSLSNSSSPEIEVTAMDSIDRATVPLQAEGFGASSNPISSHRGGQASHGTSYFQRGAAAMQEGAARGEPRT